MPELTPADAQAEWRTVHARLCRELPRHEQADVRAAGTRLRRELEELAADRDLHPPLPDTRSA